MNEGIAQKGPRLGISAQGFKFLGMFSLLGIEGVSHPVPGSKVKARLVPAEYPGNGTQVVEGPLAGPSRRSGTNFTLLEHVNGGTFAVKTNEIGMLYQFLIMLQRKLVE